MIMGGPNHPPPNQEIENTNQLMSALEMAHLIALLLPSFWLRFDIQVKQAKRAVPGNIQAFFLDMEA